MEATTFSENFGIYIPICMVSHART